MLRKLKVENAHEEQLTDPTTNKIIRGLHLLAPLLCRFEIIYSMMQIYSRFLHEHTQTEMSYFTSNLDMTWRLHIPDIPLSNLCEVLYTNMCNQGSPCLLIDIQQVKKVINFCDLIFIQGNLHGSVGNVFVKATSWHIQMQLQDFDRELAINVPTQNPASCHVRFGPGGAPLIKIKIHVSSKYTLYTPIYKLSSWGV